MSNVVDQSVEDYKERAKNALQILTDYGGIDGEHHKAWAIDQAIRALCGVPCPENQKAPGNTANAEYIRYVYESCQGEDGDWTFEWNVGVAP
jgi:hypothetical protein